MRRRPRSDRNHRRWRGDEHSWWAGALLALLLASSPVVAQRSLEEAPGYFPLERFDLLPAEALSLEINLSDSLLALVAAAMAEEDPEFAALVRNLEGIRVRGAPAAKLDLDRLRVELGEATGWLDANGWQTMLRYREEEEEEVYVYTRLVGEQMVGLALLVMEPAGDVVLVNIVGPLDMKLLVGLAESLDLPQLGLATEETADDAGEPR
ncbi:MAG: DUF4252 domain-containing protein [Thermoanaerobaculia bacterium]|nr:DUF4252 domain-containing protein [Thermoanaerobaculia bacterium]